MRKSSPLNLEEIELLEIFDEIAFETVELFLRKHDLPVLADRLLANFRGEVESIPVIKEFWFRYLKGSPGKLIEFYETIYDRKRTPHYENLIDLFLVNFLEELLAAIIAAIIAVEYSHNRKKIIASLKKALEKGGDRLKTAKEKVETKYNRFLQYLFKTYILKQFFLERIPASYSDFVRIRQKLWKKFVQGKRVFMRSEVENEFKIFEEKFLQRRLLFPINEKLAMTLGDELVALLLQSKPKGVKSPSRNWLENLQDVGLKEVLRGISVYPGYARGSVKLITSENDAKKVVDGDILVFERDPTPSLIPLLKRAGALVADRGGVTSHIAISGRNLRKPTVVGTHRGTKILKDGMEVFVICVNIEKGENEGVIYRVLP